MQVIKSSIASQALLTAVDKGYTIDTSGVVWYKEKIRKTHPNTSGYLSFSIKAFKNSRKQTNVLVHQLQAYQKYKNKLFAEDSPTTQVRHKNDIKTDNTPNNILLGSAKQNNIDSWNNNYAKNMDKVKLAAKAKRLFTENQVLQIRILCKSGTPQKYFVDKYKCNKSTISSIVNYKIYI